MFCAYSVLGFAALYAALVVLNRSRIRRIAAARAGENFDTFCASFGEDEVPPDVLRAVYTWFQDWHAGTVATFPVRAADDIADVYRMVDEDLEDTFLAVVASCGRRLPPAGQAPRIGPVVTVGDFVRGVATCPPATDRPQS